MSHPTDPVSDFPSLFQNKSTSDVVLILDNYVDDPKEYSAHLNVISQSPFLKDLTSDQNPSESGILKCSLEFIDKDAFEVVLKYLYNVKVDFETLTLEELIAVINVATNFGVTGLIEKSVQVLLNSETNITPNNFFTLYALAAAHPEKFPTLKQNLFAVANKIRIEKICKHMRSVTQHLIYQFIEDGQAINTEMATTLIVHAALMWSHLNIPIGNVRQLREFIANLMEKLDCFDKSDHIKLIYSTFKKYGRDESKLSDELFVFLYQATIEHLLDFVPLKQ